MKKYLAALNLTRELTVRQQQHQMIGLSNLISAQLLQISNT